MANGKSYEMRHGIGGRSRYRLYCSREGWWVRAKSYGEFLQISFFVGGVIYKVCA